MFWYADMGFDESPEMITPKVSFWFFPCHFFMRIYPGRFAKAIVRMLPNIQKSPPKLSVEVSWCTDSCKTFCFAECTGLPLESSENHSGSEVVTGMIGARRFGLDWKRLLALLGKPVLTTNTFEEELVLEHFPVHASNPSSSPCGTQVY